MTREDEQRVVEAAISRWLREHDDARVADLNSTDVFVLASEVLFQVRQLQGLT